jgi:hypothetical protein
MRDPFKHPSVPYLNERTKARKTAKFTTRYARDTEVTELDIEMRGSIFDRLQLYGEPYNKK